jgi:ATP-dependent Lon protease
VPGGPSRRRQDLPGQIRARATGRKFVRLSLGGVRDEAEIRGHRRTYIGAMPGKIIQSLKKAGVNNPVFCLDEVDKMSMDFRGDPSAALLEVLDPEQNYSFNDHYLDVDYDLSDILFITTANTLPDIPLPLQDRMEIIRLPGYTELEKYNIAKEFLVPKQIIANGLKDEHISFSKGAILPLFSATPVRRGAQPGAGDFIHLPQNRRQVVNQKGEKKHVFRPPNHRQIPGTAAIQDQPDRGKGSDRSGDRTGLDPGRRRTAGVETLTMPGKGKLSITGKLGDVMKESAQAAVSLFVPGPRIWIDENFYKELDLHIHIPEGAIPKDGPSAGISMCTSWCPR